MKHVERERERERIDRKIEGESCYNKNYKIIMERRKKAIRLLFRGGTWKQECRFLEEIKEIGYYVLNRSLGRWKEMKEDEQITGRI